MFVQVSGEELHAAEVIVLETCFPAAAFAPLADLLLKRATNPRCKVVLYHDLKHLWAALPIGLPNSSDKSMNIPVECSEKIYPYSGSPASNGHSSGASGTNNQSSILQPSSTAAVARSSVPPCPFHQLPANVDPAADRFATSWAPKAGFHFFLYVRNDAIPPTLTHFPHALIADLACRESRRAAPITVLAPPRGDLGARDGKVENQAEGDKELPLALAARLAAELAAQESAQELSLVDNNGGGASDASMFVPGRRVEVLDVCVPTDLLCLGDDLEDDKDGGEWNAGWVLGPSRLTKRPHCYCVVLDDSEVEECVEAACMRILRE
jgi:hypothetical protein